MDKEKKRKRNLVLNGIAIPISVFALYTFIFVFDNGIGWIKNPKKAAYNKVYKKTSFGIMDLFK